MKLLNSNCLWFRFIPVLYRFIIPHFLAYVIDRIFSLDFGFTSKPSSQSAKLIRRFSTRNDIDV